MIIITFNGLVAVRQRELELFPARSCEMVGDGLFGILSQAEDPYSNSTRIDK
jgi:hypothetical protein